MLCSFCLALLNWALLAAPATAQTTPTKAKPTTSAARTASTKAAATRRANRLNDATGSNKGQPGYAAPGEPITNPNYNGKNTPPYDGPAAPPPKRALHWLHLSNYFIPLEKKSTKPAPSGGRFSRLF